MTQKAADRQRAKFVAVPVNPNHPLLKLKAVLPWTQLFNITDAAWSKNGKNVNHGKGRKWNTELYTKIIVLKIILGLHSRQMENNLAENAVSRLFIDKEATSRPIVSARNKLLEMQEVISVLVPQILQWLTTGVVAKDKVLHPGITKARAIVKNKVGKKVEFGFKYLIARLGGGYLFGKLYEGNPSEPSMPIEAVKEYKEIFGSDKTPEIVAYDRAGDCDNTIEELKEQGVA